MSSEILMFRVNYLFILGDSFVEREVRADDRAFWTYVFSEVR